LLINIKTFGNSNIEKKRKKLNGGITINSTLKNIERERGLTNFISNSESSSRGPRTNIRIRVPSTIPSNYMVHLGSIIKAH
jgi:hypothetical protein